MQTRDLILVIDDEPGMREGCRRVLVGAGYEVELARDGIEGAQMLGALSPAVALVDLRIPGVSGIDLLRLARERTPDTACIVITAYGTLDRAVEATKEGAFEFIAKPFTPDELTLAVRRALERRRLALDTRRLRDEMERNLLTLSTEQSRLRTIINCMVDGVLVTNRDGRLVLTNPTALRVLNLPANGAVGRPVSEANLPSELVELIREPHAEHAGRIFVREFSIGDTVFTANIAPILDETRQLLGAVVVIHDITRLKELDRVKSQFVRMVAHEVRAPLGAISQYLDVILSGAVSDEPERQANMLHRCKVRADALLGLIDDLLDLSTIEAGHVARDLELVRVGTVLAETVDVFRAQAESRDITVTVDVPLDLAPVIGDRRDLARVFTNLLSNAIKYNRDGGTVTIRAWNDDVTLNISIADTGYGIPEEAKEHLFEEFFRVRTPATDKVTGTGLGLSIVKRLVEAHGGSVEVQSQLGVGSVFTVVLPREAPFNRSGQTDGTIAELVG